MRYELFYLIGASREAEMEKIKNEVEEIIKKAGGVFEEKTVLEKRRLSYVVKHETHGIYIARRFELEKSEDMQELTKKLNLQEGLLRFIISKAEELPELRTKEERMSEANKKESRAQISREEKRPPSTTQEVKTPAKTEKEAEQENLAVGNEDIDKKLEEILNI
jgi:ribosomal protein S6